MPLISGLKSTTIWKAFFLNSLASSIIIILALTIKDKLDVYTNEEGNEIKRSTNWKSVGLTFTITFIATYIAYFLLYLIFGYGGGMLINS